MKTPYTLFQRFEQAVALSPIAASVALAFSPVPAHAALTDIASSPLATTSSEVVLPNVMFILDNSGSMDWDFMPDYVSSGLDSVNRNCRPNDTGTTLRTCSYGDPPYNSPDFNGIYYNPDIRYLPAVSYDKTSKTSYNNATDWQALPNDAYGIQDTGTTDILNAYPNTVFCNSGSPTTIDLLPPFSNTSNCRLPVQSGVFTYPTNSLNNRKFVSNASYAPNSPHYYKITGGVTWCSSTGGTNANPFGATTCQTKRTTTGGSPFQYPKYGAGGNNGFTRVDIVAEQKSYTTLTINSTEQVYCGEGLTDNCGCGSPTGGTFRRIREVLSSVTHNNVVMRGSNVVSIGTYGTPTSSLGSTVGTCVDDGALPALASTVVTFSSTGATTTALSYPKSAARTDCAGAIGATGCSYTEEMTNFANWYAYYRTRMQMMKTAGGLAFKDITDKYRVGFITINPWVNNTDPVLNTRFLGNSEFTTGTTGQRKAWYDMFYAQSPSGSTPLREALSRVGRYYAGLGVSDTTAGAGINNGMNHDPVQFSCQQNFAILSTDGFWNSGNETVGPVKLDGTTPVGNQDNKLTTSAPRPMFDGTTSTVTTAVTETATQVVCGEGLADTCSCSGSGTRRRIKESVDTVTAVTTFDPVTGTSSTKTTNSGPTVNNVGSCVAVTNTTTNAPLAIQSPNPKVTVTHSSSSVGGPENTLADVAQYYYITDLRGAGSLGGSVVIDGKTVQLDVGTENNVPGQASTDVQNDSATHQHMTTFTVSMGLDGTLTYSSDYKTQASGDFASIKSGSTNWPTPSAGTQTTVDDLWHAAVNGRGKYFSAKNPTSLASGLAEALSGVNAVVGAAAAAATSNLEPVAGDNFAYIASYETIKWTGEVEARTINLDTGAVSTTAEWKASAQLDAVAFGSRNIWRRKVGQSAAGSGTDMQNFTYANLDATTEQIYFKAPYIHDGVSGIPLAQWASLDPTTQHPNAQGTNLVDYLRGARTKEMSVAGVVDRLFRSREHVLGDIVNAQPVYVKKSSLGYGDTGYDAFKNCLNSGAVSPATCTALTGQETLRPATVFIAANDGMLHAFNGDTGAERWAYVPNQILPNLYKLANTDYGAANNHNYYVDGSPVVGDIFDGTKWRTILVAGLNGGGRGFYALDVTKADAPIALWEFKVRATASCPTDGSSGSFTANVSTDDCDLGLAYGNPVITKLGDGSWVVMVTSGYRNVSPGDGKGYLYVLNPVTGVIKKKIKACNAAQSICPGDTTTDSGLAKINNWVDDTNINNTTLRVYGADLQGNVWRFNTDSADSAFVLAQLKDTAGTPVAQPVTTKPELGDVGGEAMIYVATGKYLSTLDKNTTQQQTIYGIKDDTSGVAPVPPLDTRGATFKPQILTNTTDALGNQIRTVTNDPVDVTAATVDGWRVDLPTTGERVNVDMKLQLGTLIIGSNVPATNACTAGGFSFLNFLDYRTGSYISSASGAIAGQKVGNALLVGINIVRLPNNKTVAIATTSDNQHPTLYPPFQTPKPVGRRVGWRELNE